MAEKLTLRSHSSSGRQIRPTPKMLDLRSEATRREERSEEAEYLRLLKRSTAPPSVPQVPLAAEMDIDSLSRLTQQIDKEIRITELSISKREEELRRSISLRADRGGNTHDQTSSAEGSSRSRQLTSTPREQAAHQVTVTPQMQASARRDEPLSDDGHPQFRDGLGFVAVNGAVPFYTDVLTQNSRHLSAQHHREFRPDEVALERERNGRHMPLHAEVDPPARQLHAEIPVQLPQNQDIHLPATEMHPSSSNTPMGRVVNQYESETMSQRRENSNEESLLHKLADLLTNKQDRLPRMEPEVFTGDMMKFPMWINSFEALIEKKTELASERLFFLGKYTAGNARSCIQGYLTLYTNDAYIQAKAVLLSRYGDKVRVARTHKKKLDEWPPIKANDGEGLQRFANFLWQCNAAMSTVSYLSSLDSAEENQKMVKKLPYYLADRWNRIVDKYLYNWRQNPYDYASQPQGRYPVFSEFCRFVSDEA